MKPSTNLFRQACALVLLLGVPLLAADGGPYAKKGTWTETMLAAREAQMAAQAVAPTPAFKPFSTEVLRGNQAPVKISLNVAGLDKLWLVATVGGDDYNYDQAIWGEPKLIAKDGKETRLCDLKPASVKVGFGNLITNNNHTGAGLRVGSAKFAHGFWAHAPSELCFDLGGRYEQFEAQVGIDRTAGANGSCHFVVTDRQGSAATPTTSFWTPLGNDFGSASDRREMAWEREDRIWDANWKPGDLATLARRYAGASRRVPPLAAEANKLAPNVKDAAGLAAVRAIYLRSRTMDEGLALAKKVDAAPLRRAVEHLSRTFGARYPHGARYRQQLDELEVALKTASDGTDLPAMERAAKLGNEFAALQREALMANPLIDFERLLVIKRNPSRLGLPQNWQSNSCLPRAGFDNELVAMSMRDPAGALARVYRPEGSPYIGDFDLHFDGTRLLFSSLNKAQRWQIFELNVDGSGLRQVTPGDQPDVDNYDACYLPDGRILFTSTAPFVGVPCVFGSSHVATLFRMDADGKNVRQLGFEQEHDWCPTVLANGRVLYSRWEYTDTPHSNTRLLFHMNPDGTEQMEYVGSNSYWPNSFFYARPIPGDPTKVVAVISGHHGVPRMGEMVIFDPARGRREANSVVQRIPGWGKPVEPLIRDALVNSSWPKFLHPYPLSENYFLVAAQPNPQSPWGIYLVDTFDNMLLLREEPGYALLEPLPVRATPRPPVVPDKVDLTRTDATCYIQNIYSGPGLRGVPRGAVKGLRLFTYEFAFHGMGGLLGVLGVDGPWDIKRIMGTVPVEPDGSAYFRIPANTPISLQPLDAEGKAMQLMRSWMTAMPGEVLSCVGCHDEQNTTPRSRRAQAMQALPAEIKPWYGPTRGFSYPREVQPVIDRYCIDCHNGEKRPDGKVAADLRGDRNITDWAIIHAGNGGRNGGRFSVGYAELHRYVRRPGIESDYHLLTPMEFHADTTELVQLLKKGHYGVQLDSESWDRLVTWIDLNTVYHGTWTDAGHNPGKQRERRRDLLKLYANVDDDPEAEAGGKPAVIQAAALPRLQPPAVHTAAQVAAPPGWPCDAAEAQRRQAAAGPLTKQTLDLGNGVSMELVLVPAGAFVMGDPNGAADEQPLTPVRVDKPFWVGRCEVTNEQYACFDASHDSRVETKLGYQFGIHGYPMNKPKQPVVRINWHEASAFCRWLSERTGARVSLPTEAQWEYACRAGSAAPFWYGDLDTDFAKLANLGDAKLRELASDPYTLDKAYPKPAKYDDWVPKETRFNDGTLITAEVGQYQPNPWGLCDLHGNAAEWTLTTYRPYPYRLDDGRDNGAADGRKVVRGGSWRDRPYRCRSAWRAPFQPYHAVHNVGFRVVVDKLPAKAVTTVAGK